MQSQTNLPLHHLENCFKFEILLLTIAHKHRRYIIEQRQATFQNTVFKNRFRVKLDNRMRTPQWSHCFVFSQLKIMTRKWTMAFCINMDTQQKWTWVTLNHQPLATLSAQANDFYSMLSRRLSRTSSASVSKIKW